MRWWCSRDRRYRELAQGRPERARRPGRRPCQLSEPTDPGQGRRWMTDDPVLLRDEMPWGVRLTLNRPAKLNAISGELRDALAAAIAEAADDDRVRVIAIAGAGRAFCSGYDLSEAFLPTAWAWREVLARDIEATLAVWSCPKPVIAQVHGFALAGGL